MPGISGAKDCLLQAGGNDKERAKKAPPGINLAELLILKYSSYDFSAIGGRMLFYQ